MFFSQTGKRVYFLAPERDLQFVPSVFHPRVSYQTPDRRPPRITGRVMNNVTRVWVELPNERPPLGIHDAVVGSVD